MNRRQYEMIWYYEAGNTIDENIKNEWLTDLQKIGETLDLNIVFKGQDKEKICFHIVAPETINLNKALRSMQKKLKRYMALWHQMKGPYIISFPNGYAKEDGRLKKIIKEIRDVGYYDLHEFIEDDLMKFKLYLGERKLGMIEIEDRIYLVDVANLQHKINLNCFECTKKHQYGCCCGSPCEISSRNRKNFEYYEAAIAKEVETLDAKEYKLIKQTGGFIDLDGHINECNGHCALLVQHEGTYKCVAHKYALDNNLSIYNLCPLSCLMYPLEIMTLFTSGDKRILLLTSVVEEQFATEYGRWGSYGSLEVELRCIQEDLSNEMFKKADYKPVFEVNKSLLTHELGQGIFDGIALLCKA